MPICWTIQLLKLKTRMDICQAIHRAVFKFMVGGYALPNNPEKGHTDKRKTKYEYRPRKASIGDKKCMNSWPRMELE